MNREIYEKAMGAKSPEEILEIAKADGKIISLENAEEIFKALHKSGELSDDELNQAAGGCGSSGPKVIHTECLAYDYNCNTMWTCKICGMEVNQPTPDIIATPDNAHAYCEHALQLGNLNCDNCAMNHSYYKWTIKPDCKYLFR